MTTALVGYTGFVGSNIACKYPFDKKYNSQNIGEAFGTHPELLVFAGIRAEKFIANSEPEKDLQSIKEAISNIQKIAPKQLVLISTIDVYESPISVTEDAKIHEKRLSAYGANRYFFEQSLRKLYPEMVILRLPGLFGKNLKKNFIYDYLHTIPGMLKCEKIEALKKQIPDIYEFYCKTSRDFYKCKALNEDERKALESKFKSANFSALNFTDSRGIFQFYDLEYLWAHIEEALKNNIKLLNLATEPIQIGELYYELTGKTFVNELGDKWPHYDFRTKYDKVLGGTNGYLFGKNQVVSQIKQFVENYK